jgi:hypothetical protein
MSGSQILYLVVRPSAALPVKQDMCVCPRIFARRHSGRLSMNSGLNEIDIWGFHLVSPSVGPRCYAGTEGPIFAFNEQSLNILTPTSIHAKFLPCTHR